MNVSYFLDKATFTQHVKVLKEGKQNIKGYLNFQTCDESNDNSFLTFRAKLKMLFYVRWGKM
jgi:hypothetical protein